MMSDSKVIVPVAVSDTTSDLDKKTDVSPVVTETNPSQEQKSPWWRRILGLVWDSAEGDPEYRAYVQRLDLFFL